MTRIFLDTNFIVSCLKQKIPFLEEINRIIDFNYELVIVKQVFEELEKLAGSKEDKVRDRETAKLGLLMLRKAVQEGRIKLLKIEAENVDEALLKIAKKQDILASLDRELKRRIGCKMIVIRQGSYLKLV